MRRFFPVLKIHAWGGLGSQLFAVFIARHVEKRFPYRNTVVVLHSSGITRRHPEVFELFPEIKFESIDDFADSSGVSSQRRPLFSLKTSFVTFAKVTLRFFGIVLEANTDEQLIKLRPWTLQLRGHYSYLSIDEEFLSFLYNSFSTCRSWSSSDVIDFIGIHYRLGDLLTLEQKKPQAPTGIVKEYVRKSHTGKGIYLFSDSIDEATRRLSVSISDPIHSIEVDTIETIWTSLRCKDFIGTTSKISFWIAAIRSGHLQISSSLPQGSFPEFKNLISDRMHRVSLYEN
jgi:hypothetical protein